MLDTSPREPLHMVADTPPPGASRGPQVDDGDYEYYWSVGGADFRIPRALAEILDVPFVVRLEIFLVGVCSGLLLAALAVLIAYFSAG